MSTPKAANAMLMMYNEYLQYYPHTKQDDFEAGFRAALRYVRGKTCTFNATYEVDECMLTEYPVPMRENIQAENLGRIMGDIEKAKVFKVTEEVVTRPNHGSGGGTYNMVRIEHQIKVIL
jgi:hypothetical protein